MPLSDLAFRFLGVVGLAFLDCFESAGSSDSVLGDDEVTRVFLIGGEDEISLEGVDSRLTEGMADEMLLERCKIT